MLDTNPPRSTQYPHIVLTPEDVPIIEGTTMKVIEVVLAQRSYGWTAEEIQINHRYLSMSQIYAALAYYWDNRQALDKDIERREDVIQKQEQVTGESAFAARLRSQGLLK
ncbi:hypothetical protein S7335_565 [Synechococcus sp. PCC 7335]|uniref:DUF433 domain-containing protein n=1 Tax=Synechococcus sp. (strain ATCC 29403 / PCC 7335) TaxID=91464 RepID=UPI00017EC44D|nr:DUF433 domain-containing protein [Synechococcus sp. PCC 7335]EDX83385.1 hypothetical protein S7335_565 [Synechococcus sp. PCC 7335]